MKYIKYIIAYLLLISMLFAQDLSGIKICIDPGHGGHEIGGSGDDRYISTTGFWESEGNLTKAKEVKRILEGCGANVILTRTGNNSTSDDLSLSQRVAVANSNNVDHFHSIHSNGYDGNLNYTLMLFQGYDNNPTWDGAKELSDIMVTNINNTNRTTAKHVRGDFDFYGTGKAYLGVLKNLQMPGQLSEGSFHDYTPESWRLQNLDYRKHEAWAIARSFIEYFEADEFSHGIIAGLVKDIERKVDYGYIIGSDQWLPLNDITVILQPGNQIYNGDHMNNGFFMFDSLEPGEYKLIFDSPHYHADSTIITVTANESVFADKKLKSDSTYVGEPAAPTNIQIVNTSSSTITVKCQPAQNSEGYIVYYGTNPSALTDYVESDTTIIEIPELKEGAIYYFIVKSFNFLGESLDSDETYIAIPSSEEDKILIINGFDRETNISHNYIRKYAYHIKKLDLGFSYCLNESVYDGDISLNDFKTVFWILGDESSKDDTFNSVEQDSLISFLRNGGNLFVSGSEIGWDLEGKSDHPTQKDKDFYHNFLKADYVDDAPNGKKETYYTLEGINGKIFRNLTDITFDDGTHNTFNVSYPDIINPVNGAIGCLKFQDVATTNGFAGVSFEGMFPGGNSEGKLVHITVPFETIYPSSKRQDILDGTMNFFIGNFTNINTPEEIIVNQFELSQNYPNPFNPTTQINFSLPKSGKVSLSIFNINGELVKNYEMGTMATGRYNVVWNAKNNNGIKVPSGTYFYQMNYNNKIFTKKMLLLK